ncbi:rhodanese-like domain-containing protein [Bacillaceae bacterium IKA-2]|nr:rhodanese-like domain-containing protein [Bacillaceae bacterium IKA-2]
MFKKGYSSFLAVMFSLILMLSMTACGSDNASTEPANNEPVAAAEPAAEPEVIVEVEECDEEKVLRDTTVAYFNKVSTDGNNMQSAVDFKEQFELARDSVFVLDIRDTEHFEEGHLEGAINIPIAQIGQKIDELPLNQEIAIVCYSGQNASQAAGVLRIAGYNAKIITGGMNAINEAEYNLVN